MRQVESGARLLILSDRDIPDGQAPIPALLATAAVHHHLIQAGVRALCGLIVETGEAREIHHMACLLGYGAGAVVPWLALATIDALADAGQLGDVDASAAKLRYMAAIDKGLLKVLSKMGISNPAELARRPDFRVRRSGPLGGGSLVLRNGLAHRRCGRRHYRQGNRPALRGNRNVGSDPSRHAARSRRPLQMAPGGRNPPVQPPDHHAAAAGRARG